MKRKRDGFIPLGDGAEAVALPGDRALTHRTAAAARRRFTRPLANPSVHRARGKPAGPRRGSDRPACWAATGARPPTGAGARPPRTDGRGVESHTTAHRRGRLDAVIASLLFMGGLRRSEVSALDL